MVKVMSVEFFLLRSFEKMLVGEREAQWKYAVRTTLHVSYSAPDLNPKVNGRCRPTEGVWVDRVSYGTQFKKRNLKILYSLNY